MSREKTTEEVRDEFLDKVRSYVDYWERESRTETTREKLDGLAFSLMVLLDGGTELPAFAVVPWSSKEDREYLESEGENWYPETRAIDLTHDIAGGLHELLGEDSE